MAKRSIFFLFSLFLAFEYIILGPFSYVRIGDNMDIFIPRLVSLWQGFFVDGFSFWDGRFAGGIDRLANDMVYPNVGGLLFGILPAWVAYGLVLLARHGLADGIPIGSAANTLV